jgi:hypothetical protein
MFLRSFLFWMLFFNFVRIHFGKTPCHCSSTKTRECTFILPDLNFQRSTYIYLHLTDFKSVNPFAFFLRQKSEVSKSKLKELFSKSASLTFMLKLRNWKVNTYVGTRLTSIWRKKYQKSIKNKRTKIFLELFNMKKLISSIFATLRILKLKNGKSLTFCRHRTNNQFFIEFFQTLFSENAFRCRARTAASFTGKSVFRFQNPFPAKSLIPSSQSYDLELQR